MPQTQLTRSNQAYNTEQYTQATTGQQGIVPASQGQSNTGGQGRVEALKTCRSMHTTHHKKQHMQKYAHAEWVDRTTEKVATKKVAAENEQTHKLHRVKKKDASRKCNATNTANEKQPSRQHRKNTHSDNGGAARQSASRPGTKQHRREGEGGSTEHMQKYANNQ